MAGGQPGDLRVGNLRAFGQLVREGAQAAAEHHSEGRPQRRAAFDKRSGLFDHRSIPAMHADMKLAMLPAATARSPSRARSDFRLGASAPMPPI